MLALTKRTDYALIALSHVARQSHRVVSAREIGEASGIPLPTLTNILKTLTGAGIIYSTRGAAGGYGLARSIDSVTLHELIATIEGPFHLAQCVPPLSGSNKGPCELERTCPIRRPVHRIHARLTEFLDGVSLAEIIDATVHQPTSHLKRGRRKRMRDGVVTETPE
jgi:Rrf2 family protein